MLPIWWSDTDVVQEGMFASAEHCLERVAALGGSVLAEQLAEAIRRERARPIMSADWALAPVTGARYHRSRPCSRDQKTAAPGPMMAWRCCTVVDHTTLEAIYYFSQVALFLLC
ncbi:MAG TPA: hypothetical protein VFU69_11795 [Ktedonobacterales bacterium]|nr:hypothetical protein [Ktedonobacterales bacterium]